MFFIRIRAKKDTRLLLSESLYGTISYRRNPPHIGERINRTSASFAFPASRQSRPTCEIQTLVPTEDRTRKPLGLGPRGLADRNGARAHRGTECRRVRQGCGNLLLRRCLPRTIIYKDNKKEK